MQMVSAHLAWGALNERRAERKENRPAFIAALIMAQAEKAKAEGQLHGELTPFMAAALAAEFVRLARSIKGLCEADCNYGLSPSQESRLKNLELRFAKLASPLGFEAKTGGDPRGACAYLIDPDNPSHGDGFGKGWAVYA